MPPGELVRRQQRPGDFGDPQGFGLFRELHCNIGVHSRLYCPVRSITLRQGRGLYFIAARLIAGAERANDPPAQAHAAAGPDI